MGKKKGNRRSPVAAPPVVPAPRKLDPRLSRMVTWGVLVVLGAAWMTVHLGIAWPAVPAVAIASAVLPVLHVFYFGREEKTRRQELVLWAEERMDVLATPRILWTMAAVLVAVAMFICTIEIRGLPEGTSITARSFAGTKTRTVRAAANEPLRLHFVLPFRKIEIESDRHATTVRRTWPVFLQSIPAAQLEPYAAVVLRLPLGAQRYLDGGRFVIDGGATYETTVSNGAILIGNMPLVTYDAQLHAHPELQPPAFPASVPEDAQKTALSLWSNPVVAPAPHKKLFRVAYVVADGVEVAAKNSAGVPPAGLRAEDMEWTWGK